MVKIMAATLVQKQYLSSQYTLPSQNFRCTSPTGPRLSPSTDTTFLFVGIIFSWW